MSTVKLKQKTYRILEKETLSSDWQGIATQRWWLQDSEKKKYQLLVHGRVGHFATLYAAEEPSKAKKLFKVKEFTEKA